MRSRVVSAIIRRWPRVIARVVGIGVSAALLVTTGAIVYRALVASPYRDMGRVFAVWSAADSSGRRTLPHDAISALQATSTIASAASYGAIDVKIAKAGQPSETRARGAFVSQDFLTVLGVRPVAGRDFEPLDFSTGAQPTALIRLPGIRGDVGPPTLDSTVLVSGTAYRVIGILPDDFAFPDRDTSVLMALQLPPRSGWSGGALVRTRDNVTSVSLQRDLAVALALAEQPNAVSVASLRDVLLGGIDKYLWLLAGLNLLLFVTALVAASWDGLADSIEDATVLAVQGALGVRLRDLIIAHALRAVWLGLAASAVATPASALALQSLGRLQDYVPFITLAFGPTVLAGCLMVPAAAMLLASFPGTLLAIRLSRRSALVTNVRAASVTPWQGIVIVTQSAIVLAACVGALWTAITITRTVRNNAGLGQRQLTYFRLNAPTSGTGLASSVLSRVGQLQSALNASGASAAVSNVLPLSGEDVLAGVSVADDNGNYVPSPDLIRLRVVTDEFFAVAGIRCLQGTCSGSPSSGPPAVIVNASFARRFFRGANPLNRRFRGGSGSDWTIIGVVADVAHDSIFQEAPPKFYIHYNDASRLHGNAQDAVAQRTFVISPRSTSGTAQTTALREIAARVFPEATLEETTDFDSLVWRSLGYRPLVAACGSIIAITAVAIMISTLLAFTVQMITRRRRELAVMAALGASPGGLLLSQLRRQLLFACVGALAGIVLASGLVSALHAYAFVPIGIAAPSPWTLGAVILVTAAIVVSVAIYRASVLMAQSDLAPVLRE